MNIIDLKGWPQNFENMGLSNKSRLTANNDGPVISNGCRSPVPLPSCLTTKIFSYCNLHHQIKDVYPVCSHNRFFLRRISELSTDHVVPLLAMRPYICTVFLHRDIVSFTASAANGTRWHCPEDTQWETDHSWATFTTLLVEKILASVACACCFSWFFFHLRTSICFLFSSSKTNPNS